MSEKIVDPKVAPVVETPVEPVNPSAETITPDTDEHMIPKSRLDAEINKRKELESRMAAFEKVQKEAEEERLKSNEEYKTLADNRAAEIAELKPKADVADAQEAALQATLAAQVNELPEDKRSMVPEQLNTLDQLNWLAKNKPNLMKPAGPEIGAGARGGTGETLVSALTAEEKDMADKMKISHEVYAKSKK